MKGECGSQGEGGTKRISNSSYFINLGKGQGRDILTLK